MRHRGVSRRRVRRPERAPPRRVGRTRPLIHGGGSGAAPITLQPGESASAVLGWDANSEQGQLAARSLWIAVAPGQERLSWEMPLDIIQGATVHVTAWQAAAPPEG
ncbi:DUF4232 domain-containing protein [Microbacterium sp. Se5.02b]|uniref:DUF4232 domain-containing protein n=1 Tax=Microbacterium sp. Se5.02b TaxID=2864103 RepID=UPI001C68D70D|nr:DUF4232 domain-containing protein [Microbacterium sp. Se5.02b]QYM65418.1 DUF4232 domain-containing protein [Microbacterium sp. Se5.02b]